MSGSLKFAPYSPVSRLNGIQESVTLKLNALVQQLQAKGEDVVNFTAGEPDFWIPERVKEAGIKAIKENKSRYTPVPGIPALRDAVATRTNHTSQPRVPFTRDQVIVSVGAKHALYEAFQALLEPGDEVVIPGPYWLSYPEMVRLAGGKPVEVIASVEQHYKINPAQLRSVLTSRTKVVVFNSPSNPTGAVYTREEFQALGQVLLERGVHAPWVISDEIYDRMVYRGSKFTSWLSAVPEYQDRTLVVNGLSKTVAMTGWRVGWAVGPKELISTLSVIQGQSTSGINSVAQWAALEALQMSDAELQPLIDGLERRRDLAQSLLEKVPGLDVYRPEGAFYYFIGVKKLFQAGENADSFSLRLLEKAKVATVSGLSFGAPEAVRMSFVCSDEALQKGLQRLAGFAQGG